MINIRTFSRYISRNFSQSPNLVLQPLKERSLIRTSGENVADFLQGVITNDIRHLDQSPGNLFTMILNVKGRVLFDVIVYRTNENNSYLLECDREASNSLQKHLKMYRVRQKIDIADVSDEHHVFALFQSDINLTTTQPKDPMQTEGWIVPCDTLKDSLPENVTSTKFHKDIILFRDPRLTLLGSRIISKNYDLTLQQVKESVSCNVVQSNNEDYRIHRYKLGVGEGISDLPPGNCFPLECNCDYLHGVSFHKGCYIGQELTARTHHTGVIRKRLMPLLFNKPVARIPENGTLTYEKTNLGKLRGVIGVHGLGLLRVAKVLDIKEFPIEGVMASTMRPEWWPQEAPKEQINLQKAE